MEDRARAVIQTGALFLVHDIVICSRPAHFNTH
jgi:hypothetical protein